VGLVDHEPYSPSTKRLKNIRSYVASNCKAEDKIKAFL
jgi:hypothetical protein